ncbi:hypothetical protein FB45DRAFT_148695 [Roridomyces roridus]|uniref:Uncharacterized protein n=1 Tax=Roridomyces roridus TaxID=1738132 RepID=A0AAD7BG55_9AGAR|nr:hypothetical protein FB45DRAFT_148695 [Roridomyces roridus]
MQTSLVKVSKLDYGVKTLLMDSWKVAPVALPLPVSGFFPGRGFRPPRALMRRDLGDILRFADVSLAALKAKNKTLAPVEYTPEEKSATPINECCDFLFTFTHSDIPLWPLPPQLAPPRADKKTNAHTPTPISDCCDFLFTFTQSVPLAGLPLDSDHHTEPKLPQVQETPNVPPVRPSLVSFLDSVPIETLLQVPVAEEEEVFAFIGDLSIGSDGVDAAQSCA